MSRWQPRFACSRWYDNGQRKRECIGVHSTRMPRLGGSASNPLLLPTVTGTFAVRPVQNFPGNE